MAEINRILITDDLKHTDKFSYEHVRIFIPSDYEDDDKQLVLVILKSLSLLSLPTDIRTTYVKMNNVKLTSAYIAVNMRVVTAGQLNAQKNEIMRGWLLQESEYKKPWWRFW